MLEFLACKEIQPVNTKGNQSRIFIGRTDAEALILWPPDAKNHLIGKDPDAGKDWGQEKKGRQRMRWFDGITDSMFSEFEQTPGDSEGQGSLACCSPWDCKELDITYRLNSKREVEVWSSATTQSLALCTPLPLVSGMVIPWNETPSSSLPCAFTRAR